MASVVLSGGWCVGLFRNVVTKHFRLGISGVMSKSIVCNPLPPSRFFQPQADQLTEEQIAGRNAKIFVPIVPLLAKSFHIYHLQLDHARFFKTAPLSCEEGELSIASCLWRTIKDD